MFSENFLLAKCEHAWNMWATFEWRGQRMQSACDTEMFGVHVRTELFWHFEQCNEGILCRRQQAISVVELWIRQGNVVSFDSDIHSARLEWFAIHVLDPHVPATEEGDRALRTCLFIQESWIIENRKRQREREQPVIWPSVGPINKCGFGVRNWILSKHKYCR